MTLTQLISIRHFLSKVVVRGAEEQEFLNLINAIDALIARHKAA
jgi:hypothetical protein